MVSFPRLSQTIRMTALLGRLGRSFLIVMDLLEDCPCDLKCNSDCPADDDEQLKNVFQLHEASPLSAFASGEAKSFSSPSGAQPKGARPPIMQSTPLPPKRHLQHTTKTAYLQRKLPVSRLYALPGVLPFLQTVSAPQCQLAQNSARKFGRRFC